ncbi:MAG TPA: hypothetical protein VD902_06475 [Symbiobacteriaceae bacterium]|nr:hypothetical protein [Symbiobacteriaceae bacterium]
MSHSTSAMRDSMTMLRRDMRHSLRNLSMTLSGLLTPAIIIMTVGSGVATTAVNLVMDMNESIINRFRTMAIARASV